MGLCLRAGRGRRTMVGSGRRRGWRRRIFSRRRRRFRLILSTQAQKDSSSCEDYGGDVDAGVHAAGVKGRDAPSGPPYRQSYKSEPGLIRVMRRVGEERRAACLCADGFEPSLTRSRRRQVVISLDDRGHQGVRIYIQGGRPHSHIRAPKFASFALL
jgi:hypothetical protein